MFSKASCKKVATLLMAGCFLSLAACSDFLNEKKHEPETIELSNARFACLKSLPDQVNQYTEGKVSAEDIRAGFDCGKDALLYFKSKTKGSLENAYTLEDMRNFFGKYFLKRNNVSPEFAGQLFKLKKVILGGDEHFITKDELQKMVELLELLKEHAVLLSPHFQVLMGRKAQPTWADVNSAIEQLRATSWVLLREVDLVNSDYSFDDLKKFFEGLNHFINSTQPFYLYETVDQNMALIDAVKRVIIGENPRFENIGDWDDAVRTILQLYKGALRYHYFIQDNPLDNSRNLDLLIAFADDGFRLVEDSLPMRHSGAIPFSAIDNLLDKVVERQLVPANISAASIKELYKKVILRLLDPRRQGDARGLDGLEKNHVAALKQEWKSYRLHQSFINTLSFDTQKSIGKLDLFDAARLFKAKDYVALLSQNSLEQDALMSSWQQGAKLLSNPWPVMFNPAGKVWVTNQPAAIRQTWSSLTRWNVMRSLGRAMMTGYGPQGISEKNLELWYDDFQKIGIEMKAFDPRSGNSGARSFKEANFFTFSGNGNNVMDAQETFEFISVLLSGGMSSSNRIRLDMVQKGCGLSELDIFGYPLFDEQCFQRTLREQTPVYFDNMPGLVQQVAKMSPAQWETFYQNLMGSARTSAIPTGKIETSDLRTAVMMLHYTETLMVVYDQNHNGTLDENEVKLAAPRFLEFMRTVSPVQADFVVSDFFLYLVFKGKKPEIADYLLFQAEKAFGSLGEVSRDKILSVFKVLKEEAAQK